MHPSIEATVHALRALAAKLTPVQYRYLLLRALAALWKRTAGEHFALAPGSAGRVEACALALERAALGSPASNRIGPETVFRLLGASDYAEDLLELVLGVRHTPGGHEVALIAAYDCKAQDEGVLYFVVLRSELLTGISEELDFDDAHGALLDFFSHRSPDLALPGTEDIR